MATALLNLGFRPFYLLASFFACVSVVVWMLQYAGVLPGGLLRGVAWHSREMVFGFAFAVIAGFLFTAVRNWTQQPTPTGARLAAVVAIWVAARLVAISPWHAYAVYLDALFLLAVAVGIGVPMWRSGNKRNYFFVALLVGVALWQVKALDVVLLIVAVIAGRVIPMFTNNGVPGAGATRRQWLEYASLASIVVLMFYPHPVVLLAAAGLHAARLALWRPWRTLRVPLVWILHAAYAWIPVHLALRALVPGPSATHALTVGAIGGMIIGMMTRTARGHSGRPLAAGRSEVACYVLVMLAAVVRVFGPMALPMAYAWMVVVSGVLWSAAFGLYFVRYWPVLTQPRADGRPG